MNYNCKVIACVVGVNSAGVSEESEKVVLFTAKGTTRYAQCSKSMATCLNFFSNVFRTLYVLASFINQFKSVMYSAVYPSKLSNILDQS